MKQFTYLITRTENYSHLSNFQSVRDFNNNVEQFLADHKDDFTQSELIAFKRLVRLACKVPGVATASKRYILNAINEKSNGYGISESTFHRMKRKAIKLGMLSVETTERENGSQSANIWCFNRWDNFHLQETTDTPGETPENRSEVRSDNESEIFTEKELLTPRKNWYSIKTNNHINKRTKRQAPLDYTFIFDSQLNQFINAIKPFYTDYDTILEFIKAVRQNSYRYTENIIFSTNTDKEIEQLAIESFKRTIAVEKEKRQTQQPIQNVVGLFVKIFREIISREFTNTFLNSFDEVMAGEA